MFSNHIFKFRSWSDERHKKLLTHNEIFFPPAKSFNDLFDCLISIKYDGFTKDEAIAMLMKTSKAAFPNLSKKEREYKTTEKRESRSKRTT